MNENKEKFYQDLENELPLMEKTAKGMPKVKQGNVLNYIGSLKMVLRLPMSQRLLGRDQLILSAVKEILNPQV